LYLSSYKRQLGLWRSQIYLLLGTCTRREYNFIFKSQIDAGNYRYSNTIQLFLKLTHAHYLLIVDVEIMLWLLLVFVQKVI